MDENIKLNEILRLHKMWVADKPDGKRANLRLANLSGADLDFSCWPLWCGSKNVKVDARIAAQLAAHFCALDCDDPAYQAARTAVLEFARTSHRAEDLGL